MSLDSGGLEVTFALLTKVVAFYVQIIIIKIEVSQMKRPIGIVLWPCWIVAVSNLFYAGLYKLSE